MKSAWMWVRCGRVAMAFLALSLMATAASAADFEAKFDKGIEGGTSSGKVHVVRTPDGHAGVTSVAGNRREEAYVRYQGSAVSGFLDGDGTIEFWLYRNRAARPDDVDDGVLQFLNGDGGRYIDLNVGWKGTRGTKLGINDDQEGNPAYDRNVFGTYIPLGKKVEVGEWVHIALTFGKQDRDNAVYVNGLKLANPEQGSGRMDFSGVSEVLVGGVTIGVPGDQSGGGRSAKQSLIGDVLFHDGIVTTFDLSRLGGDAPAPQITAVASDAARVAGFSGRLIAGNTISVELQGTPGAVGTFDIAHYPDLGGKLALDWKGWGVYLEDKVFYEPGEVNLRDVNGYRVYGGTAPFDPLAPGMEPVAILKVEEQSYSFELLEVDKPYYAAVVAEMRDGSFKTVVAPLTSLPMTETAPGIYTGTKLLAWGERYPRAVMVGHLDRAAVVTSLVDTKTFAIDTALTVAVATSPSELKADEKSKSQITVTVTDANGNPVSGHKMKFVLATTSQYTGVVGGGAFTDQVGGSMAESRWGETDLFGKITATYVAGFAAKTAIIVVRDMTSNDTGSGWVKTFITATAQLELLPVVDSAAMDAGYSITVISSDEWLTADGKSQARITARVEKNGQPVEGHKVNFEVSSGSGSIKSAKDTTDKSGEARAVYTAGKKIGIVLITATDMTVGISGAVSIELRSDAPAKIAIKIDPERIPADGRSTADLLVTVTDINDNPNDNVEVEYDLMSGGGRIRDTRGMTDRRGESTSTYTAGSAAGMVTIEITVRSSVPTDEELAKAREFALAVTDYQFF